MKENIKKEIYIYKEKKNRNKENKGITKNNERNK